MDNPHAARCAINCYAESSKSGGSRAQGLREPVALHVLLSLMMDLAFPANPFSKDADAHR
jgi:hypothetical protein